MRPFAYLTLFFAACTLPVFAADYSYAGKIVQDDEKRSFNFTLKQPGKVTIRTYSYAGGTNAAGTQVPRGGFDPTLSVFDSAGNLFAVNRDGDCSKVASDAVTAFCFDAYIEQDLPAGTWQVVLTQSENLPQGPTLADSFSYEGTGNFTADPEGAENIGFWDFYPNRRTGDFAIDIKGVDSSQNSIDTSISGIVNSGSFVGGTAAPNTILTLIDPTLHADSSITATIGGLSAQILYAGNTQVNFVVPPGVQGGDNVPLVFFRGSNILYSTTLKISDASPALFTLAQSGAGQAAVLNYDAGAVTLNGSTAPALPAKRGSYIEVYGTGFGVANAPGSDGLSWLAAGVTATVGGVPAQVVFAGIAPQSTMGLQQFNVLIPNDAPTGPQVSLRLQVGPLSTQTGTTISIQ